MKKTLLLLTLMIVGLSSEIFASLPTVVLGPGQGLASFRLPYHQAFDRTLSKDTAYILTGWYFVDSTYKITIEPGTLILGDSLSGGTLIIKRGAKIIAAGTRQHPIVFTSNDAPGHREPGDWGGVVVLGKAITNKPETQQVEGGFATIANATAMYGGNDDEDSSGVLQYIRIEFGGIAFAVDNEINGLTLGGVGSKTTIDHIQVSYSNDDDFEFFGGSVNAKYLVSWRSVDDNMDTDFGYSGKLQYVFARRDSLLFDASASGTSNGFESDNEASAPYNATPRTRAKISNATYIGPQTDTGSSINSHWSNLAMIRRASQFSIFNSALMGWTKGINLRDTLTQAAARDSLLMIRGVSIQTKASKGIDTSSSPATAPVFNFNPATWFQTSEWGNLGYTPRNVSDIGLVNHFPLNSTIDPRPKTGTELATAGTGYKKWGLDSWFDSVSYRGAFDPTKPMDLQWTADWTNFTPELTDYSNGQPANFIVVDAEKDAFYETLTPSDGYIQMKSSAYNNNGAPKSDADLSAKVWTAWDNTWFYLYEEVMDDTISGNGVNSYQDDGLELKFDAQAKDSIANTIFGVNLTILGGPGSDSLSSSGIPELARMYSRKIITGGYALELALKWSAIGTTEKVSVAVDSVFGLAINTHDNDGNLAIGGGRQASIMWAAVMLDQVWNTPKYLGTVKFKSGNKLELVAKNNMTGVTNSYKYDGSDPSLSVKLTGSGLPTSYAIGQNYPNPFNPTTTIRYELPVNGLVTLKVYNIVGQEVSTLVNNEQVAGKYEAKFDATKLSSGVYFYTIHAGSFLQTKKMMLLK